MTSLLLVVLLACPQTANNYVYKISDSDTVARIIALENVWNRAAQLKDVGALNEILDDAFVYVDPAGRLLAKAEVLADVKASQGIQVSSESMVVHLHGDTAVVTGIYRVKGVDHDRPFVRLDRFVDTWHQKNGAWVSVASLATPIER
jgi:ketosteroid isomerase-like protein